MKLGDKNLVHFPSQCVLFCAVRTGTEMALAIYNFINVRYFTRSSELKVYYLKCILHQRIKGVVLDNSEMVMLN